MMRRSILFFTLLLLSGVSGYAQQNLTTKEIVQKIFEAAKANDKIVETYGFWQENTIKKLSDNGSVKKQERRTYRTIWIENIPYAELVQIDGKPLDEKHKKEEKERQKKFIKRLHDKKKDDDEMDLTWEDLYQKYDFTSLPPDADALYVFSFQPKAGKQKERNRQEKIFNHLSGKFWADKNFNFMKAEAHLSEGVTFGLGILARVDTLQLKYEQQAYQGIWLPASFHVDFKAKIALVHAEKQQIDSRFYDPYLRPGAKALPPTP